MTEVYFILVFGDSRQTQLHFEAKIMSLLACVVVLRLNLYRVTRKPQFSTIFRFLTNLCIKKVV